MNEKSEEIKVRVTSEMKKRVQYLAKTAGEGEAFIIREAIRSYLVAPFSLTPPPAASYEAVCH